MFIPVLLVFTVKGMGFDSCIAFGVNEIIAEFEKKVCFCRTQQGMDVSEYKYLSVLDYRLVKMCLKGDENNTNVGVL
jgi:hypothetical protein